MIYTMCKHCDHFVQPNYNAEGCIEGFIHLEDGEQDFDHDAEPHGKASLEYWKRRRPDLFKEYPDGKIGPNSKHHSRRGKNDS